MSPPPLLAVTGACKSYGAPVLRDVELDVRPGEVHAVVGENGAGKSTLSQIVAGLVRPDAGSMTFRGRPFSPRNRAEARDAGVGFVMQELNLVGSLSVAESLFLDRLPRHFGVIDRGALLDRASEALGRVGLADVDPECPVAGLGVGQQQLVEIGAALARDSALLLLDEPTAALTPNETERLFAQVERLRAAGTGIVFISHRLAEVQRLADRVSVLRDGLLVATHDAARVSRNQLVREMVGRDVEPPPERVAPEVGEVALEVEGLSGGGFRDVGLHVRRGEILGLAGLMGAGRTELLRAVFGADPRVSGSVRIGGAASPPSPREAVRRGLALLPEDRKTQGLLLPFSVRANVSLNSLAAAAGPLGRISRDREAAMIAPVTESLALRARSLEQPARELSGGNQQKVLIARWLLKDSEVLLVDEPTRGIDVAARAEVHRLLLELAGRGKALVVASSELEELFVLCDRILVMCRGRVVARFRRGEWSAEGVMRAAIGPGADVTEGAA